MLNRDKNLYILKIIIQLFLVPMILMTACSKEEFSVNKKRESSVTSPIAHYTSSKCANFTLIKPPVDFLFLWDNSSSQLFVTPETKSALNNTINLIAAERFDYHIMLAPLIGTGTSNSALVVENTNGLSSTVVSNLVVPQSSAVSILDSMPSQAGSGEEGLQRALDLISQNQSNGIFRDNAYTIIVLMSNGDDIKTTTEGFYDGPATQSYITSIKNQLISVRDNQLHSKQFRFISLVAHSACQTGFRNNYSYKTMSKLIYETPYTNSIPSPTDQAGDTSPDSYDICTTSFLHLFDGVNNSITAVLLKHKYQYWPITLNPSASFNPNKITVVKDNGQVLSENDPNGFSYIGYATRNTRIEPTVGEPVTGHLIQLYGTGMVTYPECLIVNTESPVDYYGYVQMDNQPVESSINLIINGKEISQSTTNGWEYIGYKQNQNIKILSPAEPDTPGTPALNQTGYFLKLHGSAIYSNGAVVEIVYDPSS